MKVVAVLEEAADDIEQARAFYDEQERGIGEYCADSLIADIDRLALFNGIHPQYFGFYRMLADRFPFGIYYQIKKTRIEVFAVLDLRRDPAWVRAELSKR